MFGNNRDYQGLINVVRSAQKRNDDEMSALALAIMIYTTPWRVPENDRKVELRLVRPSTPSTRITFLFLLRASFCEPSSGTYSWVRFPTHLFNGDIAACLTFEAVEAESSLILVVSSKTMEAFQRDYPRGNIPGELVHPSGSIDIIKKNMGLFVPSNISGILDPKVAEACLARFIKPTFMF